MSQEFNGNGAPSAITLLPRVLAKIPVLLFAGDQDFICNYMGIEAMIRAMGWNGGTGLGVSGTFFLSFFCRLGGAEADLIGLVLCCRR